MRITGGALKNMKLKAPVGYWVRPTAEKVREALFAIIGDTIEEVHFLDLFAGSGAVGIEAASRGAAKVTFVEVKRAALKVLRANLDHCQLYGLADIINFDVGDTIRTLSNRQLKYDFIFIDPPYEGTILSDTLNLLAKYPIMHQQSLIITQSFFKTRLPSNPHLTKYRQERYGETLLSFFSWEGV